MKFEVSATLVYLGEIDRYPRDKQISDCKNAAIDLELPAFGRSIYEHDELGEMIKHMKKSEAVLLPRLDVVGERKGRGVGNRFLDNMIKLTNQSAVIIDVHGDGITQGPLTSHNYTRWYEHIKTTRNRLTNSRKPTEGHNKKIGKLSPTRPGIVKHWKEYVDREVFERNAQHWRDPRIPNAQAAIETFPDLELRKAARKTIERIFGNRT